MASIRKEFEIDVPVEVAWAAFRDVGAVHERLARGFVVDCRLDGPDRVVTFANGFVAREMIVDLDDRRRRLAYSARSERLAHHHASFELADAGSGRTRVRWIADLLPDAAAAVVGAMMEDGSAAIRRTLAAVGCRLSAVG
ncbi:MAG TPA: SRPBCC family protein [Burkholderiaceae bacterium]